MTLAEPDRREQLEQMTERDGWEEAAKFAAYHQQNKNLQLWPWEDPPCFSRASDKPDAKRFGHDDVTAIALAKWLRAAGLSRYEPDPLAVLAKVEGARTP
jgi:hypothetical protein